MLSDDAEFHEELMPGDEWDEFREDDGDPVGIDELKALYLADMPGDVSSAFWMTISRRRQSTAKARL